MLQNKLAVYDTRIEAMERRTSLFEERSRCNFDDLVDSDRFDHNVDDQMLLRNAKRVGNRVDKNRDFF